MDKEAKMLLNAIIEELGKTEERLYKRFDKMDMKLESMQHEINACKLERDSVGLLLKR